VYHNNKHLNYSTLSIIDERIGLIHGFKMDTQNSDLWENCCFQKKKPTHFANIINITIDTTVTYTSIITC